MNRGDSTICWQKLISLWPSWKTTTGLCEAWARRFETMNYAGTLAAIEEHWADHSKSFAPDPAEISKLAKQYTREAVSPEQQRRSNQFYSQSRLNQARELREFYARMSDTTESPERDKWESFEITASAQVARLFRMHGEHCPPNFGTDTRRGAAPKSLFDEVSAEKIIRPETQREWANTTWRKRKDGT